jgi:hypothetical protein
MLAELLDPVAQSFIASRNARGPQEVQIHRAGAGAGILANCVWWGYAVARMPGARQSALRLATGNPEVTWMAALCALLIVATGLLLLLTGAARALGARDFMVAAKACVWIAGAGALLWTGAFYASAPVVNCTLLAGCIWTLASGMTRLLLSLRGLPQQLLPDPESLGLPVSGPASQHEAAEGMSGKNDWNPPRFKD